jgi:hypothetical protein
MFSDMVLLNIWTSFIFGTLGLALYQVLLCHKQTVMKSWRQLKVRNPLHHSILFKVFKVYIFRISHAAIQVAAVSHVPSIPAALQKHQCNWNFSMFLGPSTPFCTIGGGSIASARTRFWNWDVEAPTRRRHSRTLKQVTAHLCWQSALQLEWQGHSKECMNMHLIRQTVAGRFAKQLSSMKCDASKSFDRSRSYEELPLQRVLTINGKAL